MRSEIIKAVDHIFEEYEDTPQLRDFKEEIAMNLGERVADLQKTGKDGQTALHEALRELGDITEAADAVSRQKRQEIIGQAYARKIPLDRQHAIGYPLAGVALLFGVIICVITGFMTGLLHMAIGALMPFLTVAAGAFVYLGLTQETRASYPARRGRSLLYALSAGLLVFGACISGILLFWNVPISALVEHGPVLLKLELIQTSPVMTLGALIPFVLPALALLGFLLLTEQDRKKPWVHKLAEQHSQVYGESFGLLSGALWLAVIAVFVLLGMTVGWHLAWIVFLFGTALQCVLMYFTGKNRER